MSDYRNHTVMICPEAQRIRCNSIMHATGYDTTPIPDILSGARGTFVAKLSASGQEPATHFMAATWELPSFEQLMIDLKAGNIPSRDWLPYNMNQNQARTAAQSMYSRTVPAGARTDYEALRDENIATALSETGLQRVIPPAPGR